MENTNITETINGVQSESSILGSQFSFRLFHDTYDRTAVINAFNQSGIGQKYLPSVSMGTNFKKSVRMNIGNDGFRTLHFLSDDKNFVTFQIDKVDKVENTDTVFDESGNAEVLDGTVKSFTFDSKIIFDKIQNKVLGSVENEIVQKVHDTVQQLCGQFSNLDIRSSIFRYIKKETNAVQFLFGSDVWLIPEPDLQKLDSVLKVLEMLDGTKNIYRRLDIANNPNSKKCIGESVLDKFKTAMLDTKEKIDKLVEEQKTMTPTVFKNAMDKLEDMQVILESYQSLLNEPLKECQKHLTAIKILNQGYYNNSNIGTLENPLDKYKEVSNSLPDDATKEQFKDNLTKELPEELIDLLEL